mgnify:CR=1 FL=1
MLKPIYIVCIETINAQEGIDMIEFTVSTFNGLTIKGIGYTISEAKAQARQKCDAMGTLPKHIVSILEI